MTSTPDVSLGGAGDFDRTKARDILENFGRRENTWGTFLSGSGLADRWNDHDVRWSHAELGHDEFGTMTNDAVDAVHDLFTTGEYDGVDYDANGDRQLSDSEIAKFVDKHIGAPDMSYAGAAAEVNSALPDDLSHDPDRPDHKPSELEDQHRADLVKELTNAFGNKTTIAKPD